MELLAQLVLQEVLDHQAVLLVPLEHKVNKAQLVKLVRLVLPGRLGLMVPLGQLVHQVRTDTMVPPELLVR